MHAKWWEPFCKYGDTLYTDPLYHVAAAYNFPIFIEYLYLDLMRRDDGP